MDYLTDDSVYERIRSEVEKARQKVYSAVNLTMVETYWNIGKQIYEAQGKNERAEYGKELLTVNPLPNFCHENLQRNLAKDLQSVILIICVLFT